MIALRPFPPATTRRSRRRGQTLIFVMMVLAILSFVMFSVFDVQQVASARVRAQNASDAAALAGAKWQVTTLNAIGELNLLKLTTAIIDEIPTPPSYTPPVPYTQWVGLYESLDQLQERISYVGPLLGVFYAQQAAKLNGMHVVEQYSDYYRQVAAYVRNDSRYPDWKRQELADLVQQIADQGVAALSAGSLGDSGSFDLSEASSWARYLLTRRFYAAIAGQDWCYLRTLLYAPYTDATSFWGIVRSGDEPPDPLQFLPLRVESRYFPPDQLPQLAGSIPTIEDLAIKRNLTVNPNVLSDIAPPFTAVDTNYPNFSAPDDFVYGRFCVPLHLFCYEGQWNWTSEDSYWETLTMRSSFKDEYRYKGADSVWMVQGTANVVMAPANPDQVSWTAERAQGGLRTAFGELANLTNRVGQIGYGIIGTAAAKPFGKVAIGSSTWDRPNSVPLVLPVFTDVRLIPIMFSSGGAEFDPLWFIHLRDHLYPYTSQGIGAISGSCPYCADLILWENPAFRQIGLDWLAERSQNGADPCPPGGGGGWNGGGGPKH